MLRSRVVWSALAGLVVMLVLLYWRGFFCQHAVLIGIGVTVLVYTGFGTLERLKSLHRRE